MEIQPDSVFLLEFDYWTFREIGACCPFEFAEGSGYGKQVLWPAKKISWEAKSKAKGEQALLLVSSVQAVWGWWRGKTPWAGRFGLSPQLCHTLLCGHIQTAPGLCFACLATLNFSPLTSAEWLSLCSVHSIPLCIYSPSLHCHWSLF